MPRAPKTYTQLLRERYGGGRKQQDRLYERKRMADPALHAAKKFRNSARWQRFRDWFKRRHPLCCDPWRRHPEGAMTEHVHHIIGLTQRLDLGLDESNCAPLCTPCHNKVEAWTRAGKPTAHLFQSWQAQIAAEEAGGPTSS